MIELHGALLPTLLGHPGHPAQLWPDWFGRLIQSPRSLPSVPGQLLGAPGFCCSTMDEGELCLAYQTFLPSSF